MRPFYAASLGALALTCLLATPALAGSPGRVEEALTRASRAIDKDPGLAPETKEALKALLGALEEERADFAVAPVATASVPAAAPALDRIKVYGDLRYRHETNDQQGLPTRNRERVRMRLGADYEVSERLSIGGRISTGSRTDPNSPHQTLGEGFHRFDINLDRAFFHYRPSWAPGLWLKGGKFAHPFWQNPVYSGVLWDGDVQPEGGATGYSLDGLGPFDSLDVTYGYYVLVEQALADEATAFVAQLSGKRQLNELWTASGALGFYRWANLTPAAVTTWLDDNEATLLDENQGNATVNDDDGFASRFEVLNPVVALAYDGWAHPLTLAGEYIHNRKAATGRDSGWGLGASLGKAKEPGAWRLFYHYYEMDEDAFFSVVAGDDPLRITNTHNHIFGLDYKVSDHFKPRLWGLVSRRLEALSGDTSSSADDTRLRLDLNFSF